MCMFYVPHPRNSPISLLNLMCVFRNSKNVFVSNIYSYSCMSDKARQMSLNSSGNGLMNYEQASRDMNLQLCTLKNLKKRGNNIRKQLSANSSISKVTLVATALEKTVKNCKWQQIVFFQNCFPTITHLFKPKCTIGW